MSFLKLASFVFAFVVSISAFAAQKCPAGQHWDASMNMCMPDDTPDDPTLDPNTFKGISKNILQKRCTTCHAPQSDGGPEAKIDFSTFATTMASNQNPNSKHAPFIVPGDPERSKLYLAVKKGKMPKSENGSAVAPLTDAQIQAIYMWIKQGALNN